MVEAAVIISISVMIGLILFVIGRDIYWRMILPFLCYKFVIFDIDDEYTFRVRKKKAEIREGIKGFELFKPKKKGMDRDGEFYTLPLDLAYGDVNDKFSKRDDRGYITYYYYRNNNTPINIIPNQEIRMMLNDARASTKILRTNIFDSSLVMEPVKKDRMSWVMVGLIILAVILVIMFQDKIAALVG